MFISKAVFALTGAVILLGLVSNFILPLAMGGVLAVLFAPLREKLELKLKLGRSLASAVITLLVSFWILVPLTSLAVAGARAVVHQLQHSEVRFSWSAPRLSHSGAADSSPGAALGPTVSSEVAFPERVRLQARAWVETLLPDLKIESVWIEDALKGLLVKLGDFLGKTISQVPALLVSLGLIAIGLYFALVDGARWVRYLGEIAPYSRKEWEDLVRSGADACRSVVLASVTSGAAQSVLAIFFFGVLRVPNALLLGLLVFLGSFVPVLGSLPMTLGATAYLATRHEWVRAVVMLLATVLIGAIDNGVRPWILKGRTNLHPLLAFLSALGGIQWLGVFGIFIGPIVASLAVAVFEIERRAR